MSHQDFSQDEELRELAFTLGALVPAGGRIDRDRVMFRAGQAQAARATSAGRRAWAATAACLGLIAIGEAAVLVRRPNLANGRVVAMPQPTQRQATPRREQPTVAIVPALSKNRPGAVQVALGRTAYERLAGQLLRYGLDGLPASPSVAGFVSEPGNVSSRELLQDELRKVLDPGDAS